MNKDYWKKSNKENRNKENSIFDKNIKTSEIGKRDEETFWKFYFQLPQYSEIHTDRYRIYENLASRKAKKFGCNNWNEGLHSFLRIKLAMLKRETKAYAKSVRALHRAIALVFIRWNLLNT